MPLPGHSPLDLEALVAALAAVVDGQPRPLALHEPYARGKEKEYLARCVEEVAFAAKGGFRERLESQLAERLECRFVVLTGSGTAALHLCYLLAGVEPGDEVLLPSLTFVATANAVSYCSAVPHFVDVDRRTLGLDPARLAEHLAAVGELRGGACWNRLTGRRIRLAVAVHSFGQPADLEPLLEVCARFRIGLVEDAAAALGSLYRGRPVGAAAAAGALSFNGNKIVTTGGGGAVVTNDRALAELARHVSTTAKLPHPWAFVHDRLGFNYRMPELNAALGCAQMEQLPRFVAWKRELAERYATALAGVPGVRFHREVEHARSNYWLCLLLLDEPDPELLEQVLARTHQAGLMTRPAWRPLHQLDLYASCPRMPLPATEELAHRIVCLPSSASLAAGAAAENV